jgi:ABC-2 type transport system ATP-binding protein
MDEAERCHRLAYIAYGKLLATGTPDEVLHLFKLSTWEVAGPPQKLAEVASKLKGRTGVAVTAFGNTLHVTSEDEAALERAIAEFKDPAELRWRKSHAGLEDVFIHLMEDAEDNIP